MNNNISGKRANIFLILSPLIILIITKVIILAVINIFPQSISWIPAFAGYYLSIALVFFLAKKCFSIPTNDIFNFSFKPIPNIKYILIGLIIPALIPLYVFIIKIKFVSVEFFICILIFACINPFFEEIYWRGLLSKIIGNKWVRIFYSSALFGFSHFLFWGYWFDIFLATITTVISTFIMGILWMWFMEKNKRIIYPILSHTLVDIFNLSVAIYAGAVSAW